MINTAKANIKNAEILAVGDAGKAVFYPTSSFEETAFDSSRFSADGTLISASTAPHCAGPHTGGEPMWGNAHKLTRNITRKELSYLRGSILAKCIKTFDLIQHYRKLQFPVLSYQSLLFCETSCEFPNHKRVPHIPAGKPFF